MFIYEFLFELANFNSPATMDRNLAGACEFVTSMLCIYHHQLSFFGHFGSCCFFAYHDFCIAKQQ